jgi:hypothetical protein
MDGDDMTKLDDLAHKHGTDKGHTTTGRLSPKGYTTVYHHLLTGQTRRALNILEIGVAEGASLRMWHDYLPSATVHGVDLSDRTGGIDSPKVHLHVGNQADPRFLEDLAVEHGPFDFVVDDGGHKMTQHRISFETLFPHVVPGGWYAIEDLHTAYDGKYGGGFRRQQSTIEYLKRLVEAVNRQGDVWTPAPVDAISFYRRLAVIFRGG